MSTPSQPDPLIENRRTGPDHPAKIENSAEDPLIENRRTEPDHPAKIENPKDPLIENRKSKIENSSAVSVIIPAYNYAQYLESAVRSALSQTHQPVEVIIVDDGSTDATPELGSRLSHDLPGVRYTRQQNAGLSAARNTGIGLAAYPFVTFLDCDDEFLPHMVETLMNAFQTLPPSVGLVACATIRIDRQGLPIGEKRVQPRGSRPYSAADILLKTRFPCCVLARRSCFDSAGLFDTELRSSEDRDMWIRIGLRHGIYYVDERLVRIRRHDSNMSRDAARMRGAMRRVRAKAFRTRVVPVINAGFWLRVLAIDHFQGGWMYWDEGRTLRAIAHSLLSLALWPLPLDHRDLHEPRFFRVRAAARFLCGRCGKSEIRNPKSEARTRQPDDEDRIQKPQIPMPRQERHSAWIRKIRKSEIRNPKPEADIPMTKIGFKHRRFRCPVRSATRHEYGKSEIRNPKSKARSRRPDDEEGIQTPQIPMPHPERHSA